MSALVEIDHEYTDAPVCPKCGYAMPDAWELGFGSNEDIETQCDRCDAPMTVSRHVSVSYSTTARGAS